MPKTFLLLLLMAVSADARMVSIDFHSAALNADQRVEIYLPPAYDREPQRRYPVLYLLHGFLGNTTDFTQPTFQGFTIEQAMNAAGYEFIVVVPNGRNRFGGSYYAGPWEDYVVRDLVSFIDTTYRTQLDKRGIAGHSMGGMAALLFGMKHSDLFGSVYAMSPCCLAWKEDYGESNAAWRVVNEAKSIDELFDRVRAGDYQPLAIASAAVAFTPHPGKEPIPADLPYVLRDGRMVRDDAVFARWQSMQPLTLVPQYAENLKRLRALGFDSGFDDQFQHIPVTTRELSQQLAAFHIPHTFEAFAGDHRNRLGHRMRTRVLPFFARAFADVEQTQQAATNEPIDPTKRYLIYIQPGFVDRSGPVVKTNLGTYDLWKITKALQTDDIRVLAWLHPSDRYARTEAADVIAKVKQLREAGVPADHITLSGLSKGAEIALIAAQGLGDANLNVVALGICGNQFNKDEAADFSKMRFIGRILLLKDRAEPNSSACVALTKFATLKELPTAEGFGVFFAPRDEWVAEVKAWAMSAGATLPPQAAPTRP